MNRQMSLDERVSLFQDIQQTLADHLGLAFAVPHGENMMLYDIWGKRRVDMQLIKGTEIKKENGVVSITTFNRGGEGDAETEELPQESGRRQGAYHGS